MNPFRKPGNSAHVLDPDEEARKCRCPGCRKKKEYLKKAQPWQGTKKLALKLVIVSGWVLLILLAYKVSQFDYEMANFDPYEILGTPLGASQADIKKAYRKLSVVLHPDKETGNEKEFMKLTKAYQVRYEFNDHYSLHYECEENLHKFKRSAPILQRYKMCTNM